MHTVCSGKLVLPCPWSGAYQEEQQDKAAKPYTHGVQCNQIQELTSSSGGAVAPEPEAYQLCSGSAVTPKIRSLSPHPRERRKLPTGIWCCTVQQSEEES